MVVESVLIVRSPLCVRGRSGQGRHHRGPGCARGLLDFDRMLIESSLFSSARGDFALPSLGARNVRACRRGKAGQHRRGRVELGDGEPEPDMAARNLTLELVGSALSDQVHAVEHRDPVGERTNWMQESDRRLIPLMHYLILELFRTPVEPRVRSVQAVLVRGRRAGGKRGITSTPGHR